MTDTFKRFREVVEARTKGPWISDGDYHSWTEDNGYAQSWVETAGGIWRQGEPSTGSNMCQQGSDAKFIALMGSCVDELLAVAEAARSSVSEDTVRDALLCHNMGVELINRLAALETKLAEVMK